MIHTRKAARMPNNPKSMKPNRPPIAQVTHVTHATHVTAPRSFLCLGLLLALSLPALASLSPDRLRCEYLDNPLGIGTPQPRLSWVLESKQRAEKQTAYQILAASSEALLKSDSGDLWDSGKVMSDQTLHVVYAGKALGSSQRCYWKVRAWDKDGKASAYSRPASWDMGLLSPQDWQGQWIDRTTDTNSLPAPLLLRAFTLDGKIKQARPYVCGLGYYELHLNGKKVGDHLLDPGYTRYDKRALYVTYDVTA